MRATIETSDGYSATGKFLFITEGKTYIEIAGVVLCGKPKKSTEENEVISTPKFKGSALDSWWQDRLNESMEEHFPDIIGEYSLIESWKALGYNDGIVDLHGVYKHPKLPEYIKCSFPDYRKHKSTKVEPVFEHTGWKTKE